MYVGVRSPVPPISYATLPALLGDLLLSLVGFELIVLLTVGLVFWRWDAKWVRRVWQTSPDRQSARPSATTTKCPVALLGGAGAVLLFSLGWLLVALYPVQSLGDAFNDLLAASLQQEVLVAFHMVSVAILAALLIYGLWRRHSDIVEAGCWLLLPGQLMTAAWSWHQVLLMTSALALLLLGLLAQRHQGFPLSLRHSRRHVGQQPA